MRLDGVCTMAQNDEITEQGLREFLLGNVDDTERQRIEIRFMTQSAVRERLLIAEQDLIEDYLNDSLTPSDKSRFLQRFAKTSDEQRKLRAASLVQQWATRKVQLAENESFPVPVRRSLLARLQFKPVVVIPIIAMLIVIGTLWLSNRNDRHRRIEQELARVNNPSNLSEAPSQRISIITVAPVTVRDVASEYELKLSSDIKVVEVRLFWIQKENYQRYDATVSRVDTPEAFTVENLQVQEQGGVAVTVRLPAQMLTPGLYQIKLSGIAADGTSSPGDEYRFIVSR